MSGIRLTNADEMYALLTTASRVLNNASEEAVRDFAEELKSESIKRTPRDTGGIEQAHTSHVEIRVGGMAGVVEVKPCISKSGLDYALLMHEGLAGKTYELGAGSKAKNAGPEHYGTGVGWKYLERAFEYLYRKNLRRAGTDIVEKVERAWK